MVDARQLEPPAPGHSQGRVDRGRANPRFVVTSLSPEDAAPQALYEEIY